MKDRALLEMAAKAAGYTKTRVDVRGWFFVCVYSGEPEEWELWNPLTDDGDALRLAVKLEMNVMVGVVRTPAGFTAIEYSEDGCQDDNELTRLAIVRAAAEIGRSMK